MKKQFIITLALVLLSGIATAQRVIISPEKVKAGQQLELAKPFTLQQFISYYTEFGRRHTDLKYGTTYITEAYKDDQFTYFLRGRENYAISFFKVSNTELAKTNYTLLEGDSIRNKFIAEIVPEKDKQKGNTDDKCMMAYESGTFSYLFIEASNQLEVKYHWKVKCELVSTLINKTYLARYYISTQSFEAK
jgi:hypothetical protein